MKNGPDWGPFCLALAESEGFEPLDAGFARILFSRGSTFGHSVTTPAKSRILAAIGAPFSHASG